MKKILSAGLSAAVLTTTASGDIIYPECVSYSKTVLDFGGASANLSITDVYLVSNDGKDTLLNVFDLTLGSFAPSSYWQSATGAGWLPNNLGSIFDTEALREGDSFVTIGGFDATGAQAPGAGQGTGLDPNFGGNSAEAPGELAGWFNSSPPNLNGRVQALDALGGQLGVLIGRFAVEGGSPPNFAGMEVSVTWNQGLGTSGQQGTFFHIPTPGGLALLGVAGLAGRRRRD